VGILIAFSISMMSSSSSLSAQESFLTVSASPWQKHLAVGGPIAIEVRIKNNSASNVELNLGENEEEGVQLAMFSSRALAYSSRWHSKEGLALTGKIEIPPDTEITRIFILQNWEIFPSPGTFDIAVSFRYRARVDTNHSVPIPTTQTQINVVTANDSLLKESCESTKQLLLDATNYNDALLEARLLSWYNDDAALDCLSSAYYAHSPYHFEPLLIEAIGKIANSRARTTLETIEHSNIREDSQLAASESRSVQDTTAQAAPVVYIFSGATPLEVILKIATEQKVALGIVFGPQSILCSNQHPINVRASSLEQALSEAVSTTGYSLTRENGVFALTAPDTTAEEARMLDYRFDRFSATDSTIGHAGSLLAGYIATSMQGAHGFAIDTLFNPSWARFNINLENSTTREIANFIVSRKGQGVWSFYPLTNTPAGNGSESPIRIFGYNENTIAIHNLPCKITPPDSSK
jgi:hypothetical protein